MIGRLNHVAIAVGDIAKASKLYRDTLGADVSAVVPQPDHGVNTVFITLPNTKIELLGVLVTLHDKRTTLAREVYEQIRSVFGPKLFDTVITKSVRLEESPAYKESIFSFAPNSSGAIEYGKLCEEVISRV